jgi:hypothetical protein
MASIIFRCGAEIRFHKIAYGLTFAAPPTFYHGRHGSAGRCAYYAAASDATFRAQPTVQTRALSLVIVAMFRAVPSRPSERSTAAQSGLFATPRVHQRYAARVPRPSASGVHRSFSSGRRRSIPDGTNGTTTRRCAGFVAGRAKGLSPTAVATSSAKSSATSTVNPEPGSKRFLDLSEDFATSACRGRKDDVAAIEQIAKHPGTQDVETGALGPPSRHAQTFRRCSRHGGARRT